MTADEAKKRIASAFKRIVTDSYVGELSRSDRNEFINFGPVLFEDGTRGASLEIPLVALDEDQDARAAKFFASLGIQGPLSLPCSFDGKSKHMIKAWATTFSKAEDLALAAIDAFEAVYLPPAFPEYELRCFEGEVLE